MVEILIDSIKDTVRVIPLIFIIFLAVDYLMAKVNQDNKLLERFSKGDYFGGAILGIIPQCGISVAFAKLYANGYLSLGMLIAVFIAGSDEALIILAAHPDRLGTVGLVLVLKILIAMAAGFAVNLFIKEKRNRIRGCGVGCKCPKCASSNSLLINNILHTLKISVYLILTVFIINLGVENIGEEAFHGLLGKNTVLQPVYASLIGMIPSCMSSVVLAEAYMQGAIGFGAMMGGLCANTGYGILIVFKELSIKRALQIVFIVQAVSIIVGEVITILWG